MLCRRFTRTIFIAFAALLLTRGVAAAEGVTRIQQTDGSIQTYDRVGIALAGETLRLRSVDGKGVLEVESGACSFVGSLQRCLPYSTTLHQHGTVHTIALDHGAVYLNLTNAVHHLPHSSERLRPHAVLVLLHTARGTVVSVKGTLDAIK